MHPLAAVLLAHGRAFAVSRLTLVNGRPMRRASLPELEKLLAAE